jgi:hypothetical protein
MSEEVEVNYVEAIREMSDDEFNIFYRLFLQEVALNRHSSCEFQVKIAIICNTEVFTKVLARMPKRMKND